MTCRNTLALCPLLVALFHGERRGWVGLAVGVSTSERPATHRTRHDQGALRRSAVDTPTARTSRHVHGPRHADRRRSPPTPPFRAFRLVNFDLHRLHSRRHVTSEWPGEYSFESGFSKSQCLACRTSIALQTFLGGIAQKASVCTPPYMNLTSAASSGHVDFAAATRRG